MTLDGHIHINEGKVNKNDFAGKLKAGGIDGGVILSLPPSSFIHSGKTYTACERLDNLFIWAGSCPNLYPFFWIDPTEEDADEQVDMAVKLGVCGFKVICNHFYPGDSHAVEIYKIIAGVGKPILFHSGILWDGQNSSKYNRPAEFEALLDVDGLKFALAHVSWPWCEENIAVYGKFLNAYTGRPDLSVEMFIDITPGTPPVYRNEVLTKLFTIGYDVANNIIFGTDCIVNDYNYKGAQEWIERDNQIYNGLNLDKEVQEGIYSENLKRFLGISTSKVQKKILRQGEWIS